MTKVNKRQLAKAQTRTKVMAAAAAVWAQPGSYETGTIREIAKAAGMSTGSIFASFANKEELWREVMGYPAPRDCPEVRHILAVMYGQPVQEAA